MECNDRSDLSHCSQFISFLPPIDLQGHLFKSLSVSIRYMLSLFAVPCNCDCTTFTYTVKDIASRKVPAPIVFIIRSIRLIHSTKSFTTVKDDIASDIYIAPANDEKWPLQLTLPEIEAICSFPMTSQYLYIRISLCVHTTI